MLDVDHARIRLLYRIPVVPARERVLDLSWGTGSIFGSRNWAGELVVLDVDGEAHTGGLPFADEAFDIVVLHRTIDSLSSLAQSQGRRFELGRFLAQVARVLSAGGLVIGCVENRYGLDQIRHACAKPFWRSKLSGGGIGSFPPLSVPGCRRLLTSAGFSGIRLFNMLPSIETPNRIFSISSDWSPRACVRQIEELRGFMRPGSYAVWRVLGELGVSQFLGNAIFFWGRKAC